MNSRKIIARGLAGLADLLYPPYCISCDKGLLGQDNRLLCSDCMSRIVFLGDNSCWFCAAPQGKYAKRPKKCSECQSRNYTFTRVTAVCSYSGVTKDLVHAFKFQNMKCVSALLVELLKSRFVKEYAGLHFDHILPVPLHPRKLKERGYNQSALLAQGLSEFTGYTYSPNILRRIRYTESQALLSAADRKENLNSAFSVDGAMQNETILLVDDVLTTGSTMNECAQTLRTHGARRIYAIVFAR